jgi:hypothetical protein
MWNVKVLTVFTLTRSDTKDDGRLTKQFFKWTKDSLAGVVWPLLLLEVGATIMEDL